MRARCSVDVFLILLHLSIFRVTFFSSLQSFITMESEQQWRVEIELYLLRSDLKLAFAE